MTSNPSISPGTPDWFQKAIGAPAASRYVDVEGTSIHYLLWNEQDTHKPGLLFAHGFRAHARWWSFVAPFFLSRFRVAALDFAGMGDSGNRLAYNPALFALDIASVIQHAGLNQATVVGHSFGGRCVVRACADHPQLVRRAVIVDSYLPVPQIERSGPAASFQLRPKRIYPTLEAARARFRLVPEQNNAAPYVLDYVGEHSIRQVDGGWTWKFDDAYIRQPGSIAEEAARVAAALSQLELPVTFIYGDRSAVVSRAHAYAIVGHLRHGHGPIAIPQSHHHVMLDQPLSLVAALRAVLY
ncbi:MAG TPA: alpha/beta hydrolase [Steroidobacteraceae bacterium]|jgi:pimeloyl-ACP methyl ester carboxylesterase